MPIYEYQCSACGHKMEAIQKINDAPLVECPECNKKKLQKLVSAAGFQLKGSGWYKTDYTSSSKEKSKDKGESNKTDAPATENKTATDKNKADKAPSSGSSDK